MENQIPLEQSQFKQPSRLTQLGRAVRRVLGSTREEETEVKRGKDSGRSFFAALSNGDLLNVQTVTLGASTEMTIAKELEQPSDEYNVVSIPDGNAMTHILMTKEASGKGKYIPKFYATRTWFDPKNNDFEVKPVQALNAITDAFDVDEQGARLVLSYDEE